MAKPLELSCVSSILNHYFDSPKIHIQEEDLTLFQLAFVHESYALEHGVPSNERLEYLGDHILKAIMGHYLFERFHDEREGFWTRLKTRIERTSMLALFAKELGFKHYLVLSSAVEAQGLLGQNRGRNTPSYYENAFEAFVGALFLCFSKGTSTRAPDSGLAYSMCETFIIAVIEAHVDFSHLIYYNDNYKDTLQRYFQSLKWDNPKYVSVLELGPIHRRVFYRGLFLKPEYFNTLTPEVQKRILQYEAHTQTHYKTHEPHVWTSLMKASPILLSLGVGSKVIEAEQECSRLALLHLGTPFDF